MSKYAQGSRPRILIATQESPFPPHKGGWASGMLATLQELKKNYAVDLLFPIFISNKNSDDEITALKPYCSELFPFMCKKRRFARLVHMGLHGVPLVLHHYTAGTMARALAPLETRLPTYEAIILQDTHMAPHIEKFSAAVNARKIFLATDYLTLHFERIAQINRNPYYRYTASRLKKYEPILYRNFDAVVYVSSQDRIAFAQRHPELAKKISIIRYGLELDQVPSLPPPEHNQPPVVMFTGNMSYQPNRHAAEWFAHEVFPALRKRWPTCSFHIVGRNAKDCVQTRGSGVEIHSDVPDIFSCLEHATITVSPLQIGTGVKNKVIEAMAAGRAVVGTPLSFDGIPITPGIDAAVASSTSEFVEKLDELLNDRATLDAMATQGRKLARTQFDIRRSGEKWKNLIETGHIDEETD